MNDLQALIEKRDKLLDDFKTCDRRFRHLTRGIPALDLAHFDTLDDDVRSTIKIALSERDRIQEEIYCVENEMMDYYEQEDFLK